MTINKDSEWIICIVLQDRHLTYRIWRHKWFDNVELAVVIKRN